MYRICIIDGMSTDNTIQIAEDLKLEYPNRISIYKNPLQWQSFGRNIGIKNENESNLIAYLDGHCIADRDWLKNLYTTFNEKRHLQLAGVGSIIANPKDESDIGNVIGLIFSTVIGAAGSCYKPTEKVNEVNTAPFALYQKTALIDVNCYDEDLKIGEDFSLNYKMRKFGYHLFVNPSSIVYYYKRDSIIKFLKQMYLYGIAKAIVFKKYRGAITIYHFLPPVILCLGLLTGIIGFFERKFLIIILLGIFFYFSILLYYGIRFTFERKKINLLILVPIIFLIEHIGYSLGFLVGLSKRGWN